MSAHRDGKPQTAAIPSRRRFVKQAILATASASAAGMLPAIRAATREANPSPRTCPNVKMPMQEVNGKVAFITGGSSGIGLGIARAFVDAGMKVVIGYRTKEHLDEAMQFFGKGRDRVHAISVDVTDRPGLESAAAETIQVFGKVHVLVNNAGVFGVAPFNKSTYADWDWMMNVNATGVFNGVHTFLPRIQAHGEGGQIVTTSSVSGLFTQSGLAVYSASKFAVVGLMEALRVDLAGTNIGVSVYCPGGVKSNVGDSIRNRPGNLSDSGFSQLPKPKNSAEETMKYAMEPREVGQLVLRGMRNNDLYIVTHPEVEFVLRDRHEALIASIPTDVHAPEERQALVRSIFRDSIYSAERDRQLCAREERARAP